MIRAWVSHCRQTKVYVALRAALLLALLAVALGVSRSRGASAARATRARGPIPSCAKSSSPPSPDADSFGDRFDAEVWLTDMSRRLARQVPGRRGAPAHLARPSTGKRRAPEWSPSSCSRVIDVESNFDRFAISSATALGLMQVMPFWVPELGYKDKNQLFKIEINVLLGCRILKYYLDMERGDLVRGLARYNGSVGKRWYSDRVIERLRTKWFQH